MANTSTTLNGNKDSISSADLAKQVEILRNDLSSLTEIIGDLGKAKGDEAIAAANAKAAEVRAKLHDSAETARLQAMEMQDQANHFIKTQPATALGLAAGVGFLIGFLGSRK